MSGHAAGEIVQAQKALVEACINAEVSTGVSARELLRCVAADLKATSAVRNLVTNGNPNFVSLRVVHKFNHGMNSGKSP